MSEFPLPPNSPEARTMARWLKGRIEEYHGKLELASDMDVINKYQGRIAECRDIIKRLEIDVKPIVDNTVNPDGLTTY
jgi:hypothetical protein